MSLFLVSHSPSCQIYQVNFADDLTGHVLLKPRLELYNRIISVIGHAGKITLRGVQI